MADDDHPEDTAPGLDRTFDSGALHMLRAEVLAHASRAGLTANRAGDVMLAVHELATNAIRHGAGMGRLRIWELARALRCQVDDEGPSASGHLASEVGETDALGHAWGNSWVTLPGHGLWLVRQVADQVRIVSGPRGTRATIVFDLL